MSTIPKERLEQLASGNAWYCVQDDEAAELARIALASLEAEPYGYVHKAAYEKTGSCGLSNDREAYRYSSTHVAVYTAPPAPVSVPAAMEMDDDFDSAFEHGKAVGWNACRAAMLQSQGNCIKDGWISCSERMPKKNQNVLISVNFDSDLVEPLICSARYTGSTFRRGQATIKPGNGIEQATHWMPLPEPPQEVNRG
ncbi:TPA: DUF551 domain-containing protein [Escherichia coli]|nr:DUF551 domain-containing protein [Escherichia coli]